MTYLDERVAAALARLVEAQKRHMSRAELQRLTEDLERARRDRAKAEVKRG